jgi:hypothetical protein
MCCIYKNIAAGPTYRGTVAAARWLGKDAALLSNGAERGRSEGDKRVVVVDADV